MFNKKNTFKINVIRAQLPGIVTFKDQIQINEKHNDWLQILKSNNLCHLCVIESHNKNGDFAQGFLTRQGSNGFKFGDVAPVESAWRRSAEYPFAGLLQSTPRV